MGHHHQRPSLGSSLKGRAKPLFLGLLSLPLALFWATANSDIQAAPGDNPIELTATLPPSHALDFENLEQWADAPRVNAEDFITPKSLNPGEIDFELHLYDDDDATYFLLIGQGAAPPEGQPTLPQAFIFLVDRADTMIGLPQLISAQVVAFSAEAMHSSDHFNFTHSSHAPSLFHPTSVEPTSEHLMDALRIITRPGGYGGEHFYDALRLAYAQPHRPGVSQSVIWLSDGRDHLPPEALDLIANHRDQINFFPVGVGQEIHYRNIARASRASDQLKPTYISRRRAAEGQARDFGQALNSALLTDIQVEFEGDNPLAPQTFVGSGDLFAQMPLMIRGRLDALPTGYLTVYGVSADGPWQHFIDIENEALWHEGETIPAFWAQSIRRLEGDRELAAQIYAEQTKNSQGIDLSNPPAFSGKTPGVKRSDSAYGVTYRSDWTRIKPLRQPPGQGDGEANYAAIDNSHMGDRDKVNKKIRAPAASAELPGIYEFEFELEGKPSRAMDNKASFNYHRDFFDARCLAKKSEAQRFKLQILDIEGIQSAGAERHQITVKSGDDIPLNPVLEICVERYLDKYYQALFDKHPGKGGAYRFKLVI